MAWLITTIWLEEKKLYQNDPLESAGGSVFFTFPPTFEYTVTSTEEKFETKEESHHKAYVEYLKNQLFENQS
jgi:hypothetical protein